MSRPPKYNVHLTQKTTQLSSSALLLSSIPYHNYIQYIILEYI